MIALLRPDPLDLLAEGSASKMIREAQGKGVFRVTYPLQQTSPTALQECVTQISHHGRRPLWSTGRPR